MYVFAAMYDHDVVSNYIYISGVLYTVVHMYR